MSKVTINAIRNFFMRRLRFLLTDPGGDTGPGVTDNGETGIEGCREVWAVKIGASEISDDAKAVGKVEGVELWVLLSLIVFFG